MTLKEIIKTWYCDLVASGLGVALIVYSFEIKSQNEFWWIAFFSGILFNVPTLYFQIWINIKEYFKEDG